MNHYDTTYSFVKNSIFKNNSCKIDDPKSAILNSAIRISAFVKVSECIFSGNKAKFTFYVLGRLIKVINCTVDNLSVGTYFGSVDTHEITTDPFDLALELLSLGKCEAEHPISFEYPIFPSKKKKNVFHLI